MNHADGVRTSFGASRNPERIWFLDRDVADGLIELARPRRLQSGQCQDQLVGSVAPAKPSEGRPLLVRVPTEKERLKFVLLGGCEAHERWSTANVDQSL
jgi:hypothetical protein